MRSLAVVAMVLVGVALLLVSAAVTVVGVLLILGGLMSPVGPQAGVIPGLLRGLVVAAAGVGLGALGLVALLRGPRYLSRWGQDRSN
jgi:hypothetical protein